MFHYFTIKFHLSFSLIFASNFSLRFTKRSIIQVYFFTFFRYFSHFSHYFCFFHFFSLFFALNFSLRFDLVLFASKRNKAKGNSSLFFCFFRFFHFFFEVNHVKSGFFCFQAKWNFRFNFKLCFRSESEGAPYVGYLSRAAWASWKKWPRSRESFVVDGNFTGCPLRAHFPRNETLDSLSTLSS